MNCFFPLLVDLLPGLFGSFPLQVAHLFLQVNLAAIMVSGGRALTSRRISDRSPSMNVSSNCTLNQL
jgi:hypothetical protein